MKKLILLLIASALTIAIPACNTISGVGEDVSAVGRAVSGGASGARSNR